MSGETEYIGRMAKRYSEKEGKIGGMNRNIGET